MPAGDVRPKTHCECGEWIADSMFEKHRDGQKHKNVMADKRARDRGHYYFVPDDVAFALMRLGLSAHFTQVRSELYGDQKNTLHWKTSDAVLRTITIFNSRKDDRPEDTMHAALVFASVYGDQTPRVLINMIDAEIEAGKIKMDSAQTRATRESDLVALLRANGVRSPALTLTNLMPHLLSVALSELPGVAQ